MKEYDKAVKDVIGKVRTFFERAFTDISVASPPLSPGEFAGRSFMVVCTHRSHADYFLLGLLASELGIDNLRFAAGDNLTSLPYVGRKYRGYGAFTVKRDSARNRTYISNLCEQVAAMLLDGDSIIVFPEGGRSYKGNMMDINQVVLGAAVVAQARDPKREVMILPAAISYEQLPELRYFEMLGKGKGLRKPQRPVFDRLRGNLMYLGADMLAFAGFIGGSRLGRSFGSVYVDIGMPFPAADVTELQRNNGGGADDFWSNRGAVRNVAAETRRRLLSLYALLPEHLVAYALRESGTSRPDEVAPAMPDLVRRLEAQGRNIRAIRGKSGEELVREGVSQLQRSRGLTSNGSEPTIARRSILDYYAAAIE